MDGPAAADDLPSDAPKPGDVFEGDYRVGRVLGVGGVGLVFAAQRLSNGERVAIKMLLPEHVRKGEVVERFLREGRIAQRLDSPHCTRVFEVGTAADGTPFLVMEYLTGVDLDKVLETRGTIPYTQAVDWVLEACEGIAQAHKTKTVHRDLKPANLFLAKVGGREVVKVLDFGISKSIALGHASLQMTRTAALLGSPYYMSPEQFKSSRDVDERTDIWSIGVILFELLSGTRPFEAPSLAELSVKVLMADAPVLVAAGIPPGLASVVATCLRKDPALRFTNLADFADAIAIHGSPKARGSAQRIIATLGMPAERASTRKTVAELADTAPLAHSPSHASLPPGPSPSQPDLLMRASMPPSPSHPSLVPPSHLATSNAGLSNTITGGRAWPSTGITLAATAVFVVLGIMLISLSLGHKRQARAAALVATEASAAQAAQAAPPPSVAVDAPAASLTTSGEPAQAHVPPAASAAAARDAGAPVVRPAARRRPQGGAGIFGTEN
jgi:serine/threonine-protein kinase